MSDTASAEGSGDGGRARAIVLGGLALAAVLRLYRLTAQSLWFDEGTTLQMTDHAGVVENVRRLYHLNTGGERFQPLYNVVMAAWRSAFGDGAASLRLFSAMAGIAAVVLVVATARRVFGVRHAAWTAALAACSGFAVFYAQEARPYSLLLLLLAAQLHCFTPVLAGWPAEATSPWWRRAHLAVAAVGSFGSLFFVMFLGALSLAHLATVRSLRGWARWWIPTGVVLLPALAFYFGGGHASNPAEAIVVTRYGFPVFESIAFVVYGVVVGLTYGPSVLELHGPDRWGALRDHALELGLLAVVGLWLALALARRLWRPAPAERSERPAALILLGAAAGALLLGAVLAVITRVTWLPRHSFYLWAPLVLVLPLVATPRRRLGWVPVALLVGMNLVSLYKYYFRYEYSKDDYRGVAQYVMRSDASLPSVLAYGWARLLRYYGDTRTVDGTGHWDEPVDVTIRRLTQGAPRALVILTHEAYWRTQHGADLPSAVAASYAVEDAAVFQNATVYRLVAKARADARAP